jgi:hypothetical protein
VTIAAVQPSKQSFEIRGRRRWQIGGLALLIFGALYWVGHGPFDVTGPTFVLAPLGLVVIIAASRAHVELTSDSLRVIATPLWKFKVPLGEIEYVAHVNRWDVYRRLLSVRDMTLFSSNPILVERTNRGFRRRSLALAIQDDEVFLRALRERGVRVVAENEPIET